MNSENRYIFQKYWFLVVLSCPFIIGILVSHFEGNENAKIGLVLLTSGFLTGGVWLLIRKNIIFHKKAIFDIYSSLFFIFFSINTTFFSSIGYGRSVDELQSDPLNAINLSRAGLLIAGLAIIFRYYGSSRKFALVIHSNAFAYIIFTTWALFSTLWSPSPIVTLGKSFEIVSVAIITGAVFIIVEGHKATDTIILKIWNFLLLIIFLRLCALWIGAIIQPSIGFVVNGELFPQLVGSIGGMHPNTSGLLSLLLIAVGFFRLSGVYSKKLLTYGYIFLGLVTLLFSQARSSIFLLPFIILLEIILSRKKKLVLIITTVIILGLLICWNCFPETLIGYIKRGQSDQTFFSLSGRINHWSQAFQYIQGSAIIGHSYYAGTRIFLAENYTYSLSNLDNGYIQVIFELGIIGLLLYINYYLRIFLGIIRQLKNSFASHLLEYSKEFLLVFIIIFLHSFLGPTVELLGYTPLLMVPIVAYSSKR